MLDVRRFTIGQDRLQHSRLVTKLARDNNVVVRRAVLESPDTVVLKLDERLGLLVRLRLGLVCVLGRKGSSELTVSCESALLSAVQ
jgi:hypothetical protein